MKIKTAPEEFRVALDAFTRAYLEAALWSSTGDNDEPLDSEKSITDIAPAALAAAVNDCREFRAVAGSLLENWPDEQAGHDLWLTRCGHGAGFWDRYIDHKDKTVQAEVKEQGGALSKLVGQGTAFPGLDLYIGDDGLIYGLGERTE